MGISVALREISPIFRRINASPLVSESVIFRFPPFGDLHSRAHLLSLRTPPFRLFSPSRHWGEFNSTNHLTSLTIILFRGLSWLGTRNLCKWRKLNPGGFFSLVSARRGRGASAGNRVLDERRARVRRHRQPQLGDGRRGRLRRHLAPQTDQDGEWTRKSWFYGLGY